MIEVKDELMQNLHYRIKLLIISRVPQLGIVQFLAKECYKVALLAQHSPYANT